MRIDIITIFPEALKPLELSIIGRARSAGRLEIVLHDLRDFTTDRHRKVDDKPFGGGVGMVMMAEPFYRAVNWVRAEAGPGQVVLLSPSGAVFNQARAAGLAAAKHLILLCGHYEGVDARVREFCDLELSIGDYILTSGETAALVVVEAVARLLPGVLSAGAAAEESFSQHLLEWPQYTRPADWRGRPVPPVLIGGHHREIAAWKLRAAEDATRRRRPDLWRRYRAALKAAGHPPAAGKKK
ncbi:MAG TPA: tRNA (guanosine(37)-N1)-methyltransferase TrmD [bacterium]|uniref:tRNA (guanine-N(1)-)-methyltransferase n=1 Tax=candidate division TA06 bacterium ADurb.Bin417 TaxID=1852828 RepID=A0A1V5M9P1_UNCT6|nr:MAG: tRNA (guanine-N(1)-)-methyltransferase [candidate division TA06 bacterium ADurb.Bin417]HNQ35169.1 tRNA (guanosine(37)-N1)-methyltransferase TrmD [bacterium]HNS48000.1 tRNA (guanosine(37)-N1)-methyltransferase TrmD [bacterium]